MVNKNAKIVKKSKKLNKEEALLGVTVAACLWLSFSFLFHTIVLTKWLVINNVLGAPKTITAVFFVLFAAYAWIKAKDAWIKYLLLSLTVIIAVCYLIWLFGLTAAGNGLETINNSLLF